MSVYSAKSPFLVNVAVFIVLEVASLCILGANSEVQQSWFGRGFNNLKAVIWGSADTIVSYFSLKQENESLAKENYELVRQIEAIRYAAANKEIEWLPMRCDFDYISANVVTMTSGSQHNYLIIDRGRNDGVEIDDGIVTSHGVVGVIQSVTDNFAYAVSYANVDMVVSAKAGRDGSVGSLHWSGFGSRNSILDGIPLHCPADVGDTVYTSGFSTMFPPDIPLGTVINKSTKSGSSSSLSIELMEDFNSLRHVLVVRNTDRSQIKSLTNEQ